MNKYLIRHILKEETNEFELVKNFIYTMYDNVRVVEYIDKRNEIMVYYTNHDNRQMLIPTEICELISNYTGLDVVPWYEYDKNRVGIWEPDFYLDTEEYDEELNENYSPAGKEITPNKVVIHKSNPKFRDRISNEGLKASAGECYKIYAGYGEKCIPAIFATNSINKRAWFDSTYDDDVWAINTELIPNVKWYKDRHFESSKKHIVTFDNIPSEAIELMREGTGRDLMRESSENKDMDNDIEKNLKVIRMLLKQVSWEGLCDIWVEYNPFDKDYEIRSKSTQRQDDYDEIAKELGYVENTLRSMGLRPYIFSPSYVEDCEDEVKFMSESIDKSDEKRNKIIEKIMDDIIFPEYNHIICGYDVKNDEVFNEPVVNVTFIGGYGTKHWPITQGIQKMYKNILDEIWNTIYDYINIPVGVTMETTKDCGKKKINESTSNDIEKRYKTYSKLLNELTEEFDWVSKIDVKLSSTAESGGWKNEQSKPLLKISVYFKNYQKIRMTTQFELFDEISFIHDMFFPQDHLIYSDNVTAYFSVKSVFPNGKTDSFPSENQIVSGDYDAVSQISESNDKNKSFLKDKFGIDFDGKIKMIQSFEELPSMFRVYFFPKDFNRMLNNGGPFYVINSDKGYKIGNKYVNKYYLYRPRVDGSSYLIDQDGYNKSESTFLENLGIDIIGLTIKDLIDMYFEESINESEEKQPKYLNIIKELIEPFKKEDCVCDIRVTFEDDMYVIYLVFGSEELNDLFFSFVGRTRHRENLRNNVKNTITDYLPINNLYVGSISKPNCEWKPMNESENKKQSLMELIDQYGLYAFLQTSGLDITQISSVFKNMSIPKQLLKEYIRDFVLNHGNKWGVNAAILSGYEIELSDNKYVDDIEVLDVDSISVNVFDLEYGSKENKTSINALTNDELLTIIEWMAKTIKNGEWN